MNIQSVPFSCYGSYMALSDRQIDFKDGGVVPGHTAEEIKKPGLYLRTIAGNAPFDLIFRISLLRSGDPILAEISATETHLTLRQGDCIAQLCFANEKELLIQTSGKDTGIFIDEISRPDSCNYIHELTLNGKDCHMINCYKNWTRHLIFIENGTAKINQDWDGESTFQTTLAILPDQESMTISICDIWGQADFVVPQQKDFGRAVEATKQSFENFFELTADVPKEYAQTARFSAYIQWSGTVAPRGLLKRPTMYMSKNWMHNIWAWDHCFNAIALSHKQPQLAWDQFMLLFDYQEDSGLIPDFVNDTMIFLNCCKPPIHGWALRQMRRHMKLTSKQTADAYHKLSAWTNWWFANRDNDGNGLCEYWHGNDSGWDNSTIFLKTPVVESPDLGAYLVVQMDTLAELAVELELKDEAKEWQNRADKTLHEVVQNQFHNALPIVLHTKTKQPMENHSLQPYLSLVLGKRLPERIRVRVLEVLKSKRFFGDYGFASEAIDSPLFNEDGYWRGAIWAPITLMLADAVNECGDNAFACEIALRYCNMVKKSGCSENFSAFNGAGLRDHGYTWSASVFQELAHLYLLKN